MASPAGAEWVVWRPTAAAANRVSCAVRFLHQPGCLPGALGGECRGLLFVFEYHEIQPYHKNLRV